MLRPANEAADASRSKSTTSESCDGTASTSSAAGSEFWPGRTATLWCSGKLTRPDSGVNAVTRIHGALEAMERNPNEALLLQSLMLDLPSL